MIFLVFAMQRHNMRIFRKVFDIAEVSKLNEEEMKTYEASLKYKRDWKNVMDTALEEGRAKGRKEGREEEKIKIARQMKKENIPVAFPEKTSGSLLYRAFIFLELSH